MLEKKKIRYPYKRRTWAFNKVGIFYLLLWKRKFKTRNLDVLNSSSINQFYANYKHNSSKQFHCQTKTPNCSAICHGSYLNAAAISYIVQKG